MQDSQLLLKSTAKGNAINNNPMTGVSARLMTNIKECYATALTQSNSNTELMTDGQEVDWNHFDIMRWSSDIDSTEAVLNATNATNNIGNMLI